MCEDNIWKEAIYMFGRREKEYYEIAPKQLEEIRQFYKKLGYSDRQIKRLISRCFGAEIRSAQNMIYRDTWTFYRQQEYRKNPIEAIGSGRFGAPLMRSATPMMSGAVPEVMEDAVCAPMMSCAAPSMGMALQESAVPSFPQQVEFNTAETNDVPENEEQTPLDAPQAIFSANVNTASWSYLRMKISRSHPIDKSFVRIEEILNSYGYELKTPKDNDVFSVTSERGDCPWNKDNELLFIGIKGRKAEESVRQNLVLLVDVSGSMNDEWILVQMSIAAIVSKLKDGDTLSVIAYSDETVTVAKNIDGGDRDACIDAIMSIDGIGGCTYGSDGLENAYAYLKENFGENDNNRVFIFTDGDFNFGVTSEGGLKDLIYKKRETGIYLSIVGYGENNFKDNKMETLARNGNGNYTFISDPDDILDNLWEKLVSNLVTIAKDVKISVELNPKYVSSYRLIGYDSRKLTSKEFYDTEKAVDGIGSEHNAAALIEFKRGEATKRYSSRYVVSNAKSRDDEFAFVEIHYKSPEGKDLVMTRTITAAELDSSDSKNVSAASALAAFGLLVKDSEYKGSADKALISELLKKEYLPANDDAYSHFGIIKKYLG